MREKRIWELGKSYWQCGICESVYLMRKNAHLCCNKKLMKKSKTKRKMKNENKKRTN